MSDPRAASSPHEEVLGAPNTTTQHALIALRRAIVTGELVPGARVGQDEYAQQLGVSIAPVREALRILEQEGQVLYRPRRGYFVAELHLADLEEIYALRSLLEARAARLALPALEAADRERIAAAAADCEAAVHGGDVLRELAANRRFHMAILEPCAQPHTLRLIGVLWDRTEAHRALYYNSAQERVESLRAHARIMRALTSGDAERLIAELDAHRERALSVLRGILA